MLANLKSRPSPPIVPSVWHEGFISVNKIFKWLTLLLGYLLLAVLMQFAQNGRYIATHDSSQNIVVVDTRTGEVSWPKSNQPQGQ